jgi:hypothetical protein
VFDEQLAPTPQGGQSPPPQSTSVSFRFLTLSTQLPCAQMPCLQYALMQSVSCLQTDPMLQRGHAVPPQSTSDSSPSSLPSSHETFPPSEESTPDPPPAPRVSLGPPSALDPPIDASPRSPPAPPVFDPVVAEVPALGASS